MTMSIGEAFYPQDGDDAEQLLAVADRRMYRAKQRTRVPRPAVATFDAPAFVTVQ
jgi:GGDEF domain-containing protein